MKLLSTQDVLDRRTGWTSHLVRRLLVPHTTESYRAWSTGWDITRHLYSLRSIVAAERSNKFLEALERRARRNSPVAIAQREQRRLARERREAQRQAELERRGRPRRRPGRQGRRQLCLVARRLGGIRLVAGRCTARLGRGLFRVICRQGARCSIRQRRR